MSDQNPRRLRLLELLAWLERVPPGTIRYRPVCPEHGVEMVTRKTTGLSHFYCPCEGCARTWKGRPTRDV